MRSDDSPLSNRHFVQLSARAVATLSDPTSSSFSRMEWLQRGALVLLLSLHPCANTIHKGFGSLLRAICFRRNTQPDIPH